MANFVFTYRTAPDAVRTPESAAAWMSWFDGLGSHVADGIRHAQGQFDHGLRHASLRPKPLEDHLVGIARGLAPVIHAAHGPGEQR